MNKQELDQFDELFEEGEFDKCWALIVEKEDPELIEFVKGPIAPIDPTDAFPALHQDMSQSKGITFWVEPGECFRTRVFGVKTQDLEDGHSDISIDNSKFNSYIQEEEQEDNYKAKLYHMTKGHDMKSDQLNRQSVQAIKATLIAQRIIEFLEEFCRWDAFKKLDSVFLFWLRFDNASYSNFVELGYYSKKETALTLIAKPMEFDSRVANQPDHEKIAERILINRLHNASKNDDLEAMKALQAQGAPILRKLWGLTLAQIALSENRPSQVALYLCELESEEDRIRTLQEAVDSGDFAVIKKLIDTLNVDPIQAVTKIGSGLLHLAVKSFPLNEEETIEIITYLLDKGLDIDLVNEDDESALALAIRECDKRVIHFLREQGAIEPIED